VRGRGIYEHRLTEYEVDLLPYILEASCGLDIDLRFQ
jgi:hypothetical protein